MRRQTLTMVLAVLAMAGGVVAVPSAAQAPPEYGPANGALIIVGGGPMAGTNIMERFIELGGGAEDGNLVIVPTAGGNRDAEGELIEYNDEAVLRGWVARGVKHVSMLHTADPREADTEAFVAPLLDATAVWFNGGRQWNIVDSYANTRTYAEFHKVLERGGVVAGSSAGATIQGQYLVRGDTSGPAVMMTEEPNHQRGFAFLRKSAIDQHINTRNRWDDLIPVIERYPDLLGIGLSESTAIVVTGDSFEVIGTWKVAVHDNTRLYQPWEKPYYVLSPGDVYSMKTRSIESLGNGTGCVVPRPTYLQRALPPEVLRSYEAVYQLGPNTTLTIEREDSQLYGRLNDGQTRAELIPTSETEFFVPAVGGQVFFERDDSGRVTGLVLRENCRDSRAVRVEP